MASRAEPRGRLGRGKRQRTEGSDRARRRGRDQARSGEAGAAIGSEVLGISGGIAAEASSAAAAAAAAAGGSRGAKGVPAEAPAGGAGGGMPLAVGGRAGAGPGEAAACPGGDAFPVETLEEMLECPVCFERMGPPIFQCASGHTVCSGCKPKLNKHCPTCRMKLGKIRNLALEQLAESMQRPCKYRAQGCKEVPAYQAKAGHEAQCRFRPYMCPSAEGCAVTGSVAFLVQHLEKDHGANVTHKASFTDQLLDCGGTFGWTPVVLTCDGHFFCVNVVATKRGAADVYVAFLQCMGEEEESGGFSYRISMENKDNRLTWESIPATARRNHENMLDAGEYFSVPRLMESLVRKEVEGGVEGGVSLTFKYSVKRKR